MTTKSKIKIETAHEIKAETVKKIKSFLRADELDHMVSVNKDLIAGFRTKWIGFMYESSVVTSLQKLEKKIII